MLNDVSFKAAICAATEAGRNGSSDLMSIVPGESSSFDRPNVFEKLLMN